MGNIIEYRKRMDARLGKDEREKSYSNNGKDTSISNGLNVMWWIFASVVFTFSGGAFSLFLWWL